LNKVKGLIFPTLILLVLVVVPRVALMLAPVEMVSMIDAMGLVDLYLILNALTISGLSMAMLSAIKNLTEKWTTINLASSIGSTIIWFILSLLLWGAGDPWSFGEIRRTLNVMNLMASLILNLRFFVILQAGASLLGILKNVFVYFSAIDRMRAQSGASGG